MTVVSSEKNELISVIIPVFNVERYLCNCLNSVLSQTYKNLEIILVDDGSTDNSGNLCDRYASEDQRIKVLHQQNGGLSAARNSGIKISKGAYITFIDSDDTITKDYIEYLYKLIKQGNYKMSIASIEVVAKKKRIDYGKSYNDTLLTQKEALRRMTYEEGFTVGAWSKLYYRDLFKRICYPTGYTFEEIATTYKLILECDYIPYGHKAIYQYYKHQGSIINSKYSANKLLRIKFSHEMCDSILKKYPDLYVYCESYLLDSYFYVYRLMLESQLTGDDYKIKENIKQYLLDHKKEVLKRPEYKKRTKIAMILLSLGEGIFKYSWKLYSRLRYGMV